MLKNYRFPAIIGFVFKIAEAALELMVPLVMADIIDVGIKNNDQNYILVRVIFGRISGGWLFICVSMSILCITYITKCWNRNCVKICIIKLIVMIIY